MWKLLLWALKYLEDIYILLYTYLYIEELYVIHAYMYINTYICICLQLNPLHITTIEHTHIHLYICCEFIELNTSYAAKLSVNVTSSVHARNWANMSVSKSAKIVLFNVYTKFFFILNAENYLQKINNRMQCAWHTVWKKRKHTTYI